MFGARINPMFVEIVAAAVINSPFFIFFTLSFYISKIGLQ